MVSQMILAPGVIPGSGYPTAVCTDTGTLFRLCARTSGASPRDECSETNPAPLREHNSFQTWPSCRLDDYKAFHPSRVRCFLAETRSPRVLSPFRVFHSRSIGSCYQSLPLLSFAQIFSDLAGTSAGCATAFVRRNLSCDRFWPLPSWVLRPSREFSRNRACRCFQRGDPLRLDGRWALLSVSVGIYTT